MTKKPITLTAETGTPRGRVLAEAMLDPAVANAVVAHEFTARRWDDAPLDQVMAVLVEKAEKIRNGSFSEVENLLTAQAVTLNQIFLEMARRSALQMGSNLETTERYMRLALKSQAQCRATLETLVTIKNPPVVIARQANVTTGPQQINNGAPAPRAEEIEIEQNKLLETNHGQGLDSGTAGAAGGANPDMAAVGKLDRAKVRRGKSPGRP